MARDRAASRVYRMVLATAFALMAAVLPVSMSGASSGGWGPVNAKAYGELDCNGQSPVQHSIRRSMLCTDIRGYLGKQNQDTWGGKFYDNGLYIGHDEPDMNFASNLPGSGDNVTWTERLPVDPVARPTVAHPGHDVTHWFELSIAPWFSMAVCDPNSYPELPCLPESDANAPACSNALSCPNHAYPGGGGAFTEMQFYPPGEPPMADGESCDNSHWCAALNIDSLECTPAICNPNCVEPVNYAFITRDGVPTGPPSPQDSNLSTFLPNADTLLMNPGDVIKVHMWDAPVPGQSGQKALKVVIDDVTAHKSGSMQASAVNGFQNTSIVDCSGSPYNFEPEYSTAAKANVTPWGAGEENISTEYEIGHFEACSALFDPAKIGIGPGISDGYYNSCASPYEKHGGEGTTKPETSDALCFGKGDTHGFLHSQPDLMSQCNADLIQNGDLEFDGTPYWPEWPTAIARTHKLPSGFVENPPTTNGRHYSHFYFTTDVALSESQCTPSHIKGCTVPPKGPGHFYPYWSLVNNHGTCGILFGNAWGGRHVRNFGRDAQYGGVQFDRLGYFQFESRTYGNGCRRGTLKA